MDYCPMCDKAIRAEELPENQGDSPVGLCLILPYLQKRYGDGARVKQVLWLCPDCLGQLHLQTGRAIIDRNKELQEKPR